MGFHLFELLLVGCGQLLGLTLVLGSLGLFLAVQALEFAGDFDELVLAGVDLLLLRVDAGARLLQLLFILLAQLF